MGHLPWINALSCILSLLHTIYIVSIYNGAWPLTSTCTPWPIKLHTKCTMLGLDVEQPLPWLRGIGVARLFYEHSVVCVGLEFQQRGAWPMHKKVYLQLIILYRFVIIVWQQNFSCKGTRLNTKNALKCWTTLFHDVIYQLYTKTSILLGVGLANINKSHMY